MFLNRFFYALISFFAAVCIGFGLYTGVVTAVLNRPVNITNDAFLYIEKGKGSIAIASIAEKLNLVDQRWQFLFAVKKLGYERSLKAGEFVIPKGVSLQQVLEIIVKGDAYTRKLSIAEGLSVAQVTEIFDNIPWIEGYFPEIEEGKLLPETYFYHRGETAKALATRMQGKQQELLSELWEARDLTIAVKSPQEALILASIVEKETGTKSERAIVAGVFNNRLKKGMRLQSDPTVIYGITYGKPLGRSLLRSDLKQVTVYNTYRINGLPPTPIANPGKASIQAVLNPAKVPYLYFVADGTGGHKFASTLKEHNKNVAKWRKIRDSKG